MFEHPNEVCRLCLSEESLSDIFGEDNIHKQILGYLLITVSSKDRLSKVICAICRLRLSEFHQFRVRCEEVQNVLQQSLAKREKAETEEKEDSTVGTDNEEQNVQSTYCPQCDKELPTRKQWRDHMRYHQKKKTNPLRTKKIHTKKKAPVEPVLPFFCTHCDKAYDTKKELRDHMVIHKYRHNCEYCGRTFSERHRMLKHMKTACISFKQKIQALEKTSSDQEKREAVETLIKNEPLEEDESEGEVEILEDDSTSQPIETHSVGDSDSEDCDLQDISVILRVVAGITTYDGMRDGQGKNYTTKRREKRDDRQPVEIQDIIDVEAVKIETHADDDDNSTIMVADEISESSREANVKEANVLSKSKANDDSVASSRPGRRRRNSSRVHPYQSKK